MTAQLRYCRPYSSGYDKDGNYYEQWIEDEDERPDHDYWGEYERDGCYMGDDPAVDD